MDSQLMNETKSVVKGTVDSSINYMNLGFTLAAALAWHESAKMMVKQVVNKTNNKTSIVLYPVLVTLLAVAVFQLSKVVNPSGKRPVIVPVVAA